MATFPSVHKVGEAERFSYESKEGFDQTQPGQVSSYKDLANLAGFLYQVYRRKKASKTHGLGVI